MKERMVRKVKMMKMQNMLKIHILTRMMTKMKRRRLLKKKMKTVMRKIRISLEILISICTALSRISK